MATYTKEVSWTFEAGRVDFRIHRNREVELVECQHEDDAWGCIVSASGEIETAWGYDPFGEDECAGKVSAFVREHGLPKGVW